MFKYLNQELEATASVISKLTRIIPRRGRDDLSVHLLSQHDDKDEKIERQRGRSPAHNIGLILATAVRLIVVLVTPSFIQALFNDRKRRILHRTSFLDGLRGCAAFIVAYAHLVCAEERWLLPAYGATNRNDMLSSPLQLPFIRVFFAARPMVHIFFVISGFALSCKPIRLMRMEQDKTLADVMVSMVFRRGFRLFLPSIAGLILMDVSAWLGWQRWQPSATLWGKLMNIWNNAGVLVSFWSWDLENSQRLLHLWTIPVEFACSMLLCVVLIGCSQMKPWMRGFVLGALMVHSQASGHWGVFEFLVGMALAEIEETLSDVQGLTTQRTAVAGLQIRAKPRRLLSRTAHNVFWVLMLLSGLFLAGYPEENADTAFGFSVITRLTPQVYLDMGMAYPAYFWYSIAATLIISAIFRLSLLRRIFESPVAMYLGDLSYAVYIVHYWLVMAVGSRIIDRARSIVGGEDTQIKRCLVIVFEILILMPFVIWQADIFWRLIDKPSVTFARWLERVCRKPAAS